MHRVFNTQLYLKTPVCFGASLRRHQRFLLWCNFGITEELPDDDALGHQRMYEFVRNIEY